MMIIILLLFKDSSVVVKDTAAWTIGRVCELIPEAAINPATLQPLLAALVEGLAAEPRVASNVCWGFTSLAEAAYEHVRQDFRNPKYSKLVSYKLYPPPGGC